MFEARSGCWQPNLDSLRKISNPQTFQNTAVVPAWADTALGAWMEKHGWHSGPGCGRTGWSLELLYRCHNSHPPPEKTTVPDFT